MAKWANKLLLSIALFAGVVASPASGKLNKPLRLPAMQASEIEKQSNTNHLLDLVRTAFHHVQRDYVDHVGDRKLIEDALSGMVSGLDPHSRYMSAKEWRNVLLEESGEYVGLGVSVAQDNDCIKVVSLIEDGPAARGGLKAGDLITAVDGKRVEALSPAGAMDQLLGPPDSAVTLTIERRGLDQPIAVTLTRTIVHAPSIVSRRYDHVGYIRLIEFNEEAEPGLRKAVARLEHRGGTLTGIVLDLRDNPGGLLEQAVAIADDFLVKGSIVLIEGRAPEERGRWNARAKAHDMVNGLPMVVLINDGSASASEIVAGALQDYRRAVLVGTRSFGKGVGQSVIPLPAPFGVVLLTMSRFYTPLGRAIQGIGLAPDLEISDRGDGDGQAGYEYEANLEHALPSNAGMAKPRALPPIDLSFVAGQVTNHPPRDWPSYDPMDPATDFQLQQALTLVRAMAARKHVDGATHAQPVRMAGPMTGAAPGNLNSTVRSASPRFQSHTGQRVRRYGLRDWWRMAAVSGADRCWR